MPRKHTTRAKSSAKSRGKNKGESKPATGERLGALRDAIGNAVSHATRAAAGALLVAIAAGWIVGYTPLVRHVSTMQADPLKIHINWPASPDTTNGAGATWLPGPIQHELLQIASANLTLDPFDHAALVETRDALEQTGWFERIGEVRRDQNGEVFIHGEWRAPAAIVRKDDLSLLVGSGGEVLRTPERTGFDPGALYVISNPSAPPPRDEHGTIAFGIPWRFNEVQPAIDLLREVSELPASSRIKGIDLSGYQRTGHLTLVTDTGCRIVWGSPIDALAPGEVRVPRKLERLATILDQRLDRGHDEIELYLARGVVIDRTTDGA